MGRGERLGVLGWAQKRGETPERVGWRGDSGDRGEGGETQERGGRGKGEDGHT